MAADVKLLMCNCSQCKHGRKSKREQCNIKHKRSRWRSEVRHLLRAGKHEMLPTAIQIGYTG